MKTLLYTGHDASYKPLADITVPRMAEYAERHGMDFACYTEPLIDVPQGIYWTGVCGALKAFNEGYDSVMYLDVDQLITNYDVVWPPMTRGFHVSKDWGEDATGHCDISACGFVIHKDASPLFRQVSEMEYDWREKPFPEQGPLRHQIKSLVENSDRTRARLTEDNDGVLGYFLPDLIHIHPRKVFNCVPDLVCPGKVPEPWEQGDFAAHITMVDLPRRVEIAKEILSRL